MSQHITFKGNSFTLAGGALDVGKPAPSFCLSARDLSEVHLSDYKQKIKVLTTFPSLDTGVCAKQVKEFNKRSAQLSDDVVVLAISKDLPFAQDRFCQAEGIDNIVTLSDYKLASFGVDYGILIEKLGLLTRTVFIVDKNDIVQYVQIVNEVTDEPDYEEVFNQLKNILDNSK